MESFSIRFKANNPVLGRKASDVCESVPQPETGPHPASLKTSAIDCVLGEA